MKLLFDQNLSFKLCQLLADVFPNSNQIRLLGMEEAEDRTIWEYAKANGFSFDLPVRCCPHSLAITNDEHLLCFVCNSHSLFDFVRQGARLLHYHQAHPQLDA